MAPVFVLCWPLFPNTERGMYCALSSRNRPLVLPDSTADVHHRFLACWKGDCFQRHDREDNEQEREVIGVGERTCPLRRDHDTNDLSVLETSRGSLRHNDVVIRRWVCSVGGFDQAVESPAVVEPFQVVAGPTVLCCI